MQSDDSVEQKEQSDGSGSDSEHRGILLPGGHLVVKLLESEDVKGCFPVTQSSLFLLV